MPHTIPLRDVFSQDPIPFAVLEPTITKFILHMTLPRNKANFPVKNVTVALIYLFPWQCSGLTYCPIKQTEAGPQSGRSPLSYPSTSSPPESEANELLQTCLLTLTSFTIPGTQQEAGLQELGESGWLIIIYCREKWSEFGQRANGHRVSSFLLDGKPYCYRTKGGREDGG